jgi:hypothetical protein
MECVLVKVVGILTSIACCWASSVGDNCAPESKSNPSNSRSSRPPPATVSSSSCGCVAGAAAAPPPARPSTMRVIARPTSPREANSTCAASSRSHCPISTTRSTECCEEDKPITSVTLLPKNPTAIRRQDQRACVKLLTSKRTATWGGIACESIDAPWGRSTAAAPPPAPTAPPGWYIRTRSCLPGRMPAGTLTRRTVPSRKRTGSCWPVRSDAGMVSVTLTADCASLLITRRTRAATFSQWTQQACCMAMQRS